MCQVTDQELIIQQAKKIAGLELRCECLCNDLIQKDKEISQLNEKLNKLMPVGRDD